MGGSLPRPSALKKTWFSLGSAEGDACPSILKTKRAVRLAAACRLIGSGLNQFARSGRRERSAWPGHGQELSQLVQKPNILSWQGPDQPE